MSAVHCVAAIRAELNANGLTNIECLTADDKWRPLTSVLSSLVGLMLAEVFNPANTLGTLRNVRIRPASIKLGGMEMPLPVTAVTAGAEVYYVSTSGHVYSSTNSNLTRTLLANGSAYASPADAIRAFRVQAAYRTGKDPSEIFVKEHYA